MLSATGLGTNETLDSHGKEILRHLNNEPEYKMIEVKMQLLYTFMDIGLDKYAIIRKPAYERKMDGSNK
jgi:hypothetical protein